MHLLICRVFFLHTLDSEYDSHSYWKWSVNNEFKFGYKSKLRELNLKYDSTQNNLMCFPSVVILLLLTMILRTESKMFRANKGFMQRPTRSETTPKKYYIWQNSMKFTTNRIFVLVCRSKKNLYCVEFSLLFFLYW